MASAVVRLEKVSLVDADLTEEQVETIFDKILSKHPDELPLTQLDLREFDISSVCQDKLEGVRSIVTLRQCSPLSLVERFIVLLRQLSFAIKNQLGHPKPPTRGFGTQRPNGSLLALRWFFMA